MRRAAESGEGGFGLVTCQMEMQGRVLVGFVEAEAEMIGGEDGPPFPTDRPFTFLDREDEEQVLPTQRLMFRLLVRLGVLGNHEQPATEHHRMHGFRDDFVVHARDFDAWVCERHFSAVPVLLSRVIGVVDAHDDVVGGGIRGRPVCIREPMPHLAVRELHDTDDYTQKTFIYTPYSLRKSYVRQI